MAAPHFSAAAAATAAAINPQTEKQDLAFVYSVSEALRLLPNTDNIEDHTERIQIKGVISSLRPVIKMIAGEYGKCPKCGILYHKSYDKPSFHPLDLMIPYCTDFESFDHPIDTIGTERGKGRFVDEDGNEYEYKTNKKGELVRTLVFLKIGYEFRNASIVEIQDADKFEDLEKLQAIFFDCDTDNIRAGESVIITGQIYIEPFSSHKDSRLYPRVYVHSVKYESRREISLSNQDKDAIQRFVNRFGNNKTVEKLAEMFAPSIIGYQYVKKGLILCAASCSNDYRSSKTFKHRIRMHAILIGDPGLAKSIFLKEIVKIVPNSRCESGQNSSGKTLTAIVSKEANESTVLRLGAIPMAKEGICSINELGRMNFEDQSPLLDVMEEGEFTINKHGINALIRSPTVVIGSANPTTGNIPDNRNITLDDIPAIKPLIDRFDLIFTFKTSRDPQTIREYTRAKAKFEDHVIPNYNAYLEKHLLHARSINPKVSDEARIILDDFYIGVARNTGSPRVRETIYNITRMIARLKLKDIADGNDATEACQFYNVILNQRGHVVNIPGNPRDITFNECLYTLETTKAPISFDELVDKVCKKDEYIRVYIGPNHNLRNNIKLRNILDMLLNHSQVRKVNLKPVVLEWLCDPCDPCDPSPDFQQKNDASISSDKNVGRSSEIGSHRSHGSHGSDNWSPDPVPEEC
jgi:replicative DNA helicase Mcm